jgi:hypothetical protein
VRVAPASRVCLCLPSKESSPCCYNLPNVSIRQHTSAYVSIRQHTSAYVKRVYVVLHCCRPGALVG